MKVSDNKKLTGLLAGAVLGALSLPSQAAVTFSNDFSYINMAGYADDYNIAGAAGSSDYASNIDALGLPAQATDYQYASIVDSSGFETSFAESDAWAEVDAYTIGNNGYMYGYVDAYSSIYVETSNQDAYAYTDAVIDVDFSIDGNYIYDFGAEWMEAAGNASFYYDLYSWDTGAILYSGELINASDSPYITGVLSAGSYNLVVKAMTDADALMADALGVDSGYAAGDFAFSLTAVPVPAAVWLFGSGLLALVGVARRKVV